MTRPPRVDGLRYGRHGLTVLRCPAGSGCKSLHVLKANSHEKSCTREREGKGPWPLRFPVDLAACLVLVVFLLAGCELVPTKPDVVLTLYRDRMKSENLPAARELLSEPSRSLVEQLVSRYNLKQPPENLALINILDPVTPPSVMKSEDTYALLQVRTLKGDFRLVRLIRKDSSAPWKVDMTEELKALEAFMEARGTLELMREQAGEYAESWKAFNEQLGKMHLAEPEAPKPPAAPKQLKKPREKPATSKQPPRKPGATSGQ